MRPLSPLAARIANPETVARLWRTPLRSEVTQHHHHFAPIVRSAARYEVDRATIPHQTLQSIPSTRAAVVGAR